MLLAFTMNQPTYALEWLRDFLNGFDNEDEYGHMFYSSVNARTGLGAGKVYVEWATGKDDYNEAYIKPRVQTEINVLSPEDDSARGRRRGNRITGYTYDTSVDHNYVFFGVPEDGWEVDNIYSDANFNTVFTHEDQSQDGVYAAKIIVHTTARDRASQPVANIYARFALKVTIGSRLYSTLYYSEYNFKVPDGITATTHKLNADNKLTVSETYDPGEVIPAGEAVVLNGAAGEYKFVPVPGTYPKDGNNILQGFDEATTTTGGDKYYALQWSNEKGKVGFFWVNNNGAPFTSPAHKAYLALSGASGIKGFTFEEEDPTGIDDVNDNLNLNDEPIYNIAGQRIQKMQRGINIINGKKILK